MFCVAAAATSSSGSRWSPLRDGRLVSLGQFGLAMGATSGCDSSSGNGIVGGDFVGSTTSGSSPSSMVTKTSTMTLNEGVTAWGREISTVISSLEIRLGSAPSLSVRGRCC